MRRLGYILLGVVLLAGAAGVLGYRLQNEPSLTARYSWLAGEENTARPTAPATESFSASRREDGREFRRSPRDEGSSMKLVELGLDVANVVVGLVGIWLTLSGMSMRRRAGA